MPGNNFFSKEREFQNTNFKKAFHLSTKGSKKRLTLRFIVSALMIALVSLPFFAAVLIGFLSTACFPQIWTMTDFSIRNLISCETEIEEFMIKINRKHGQCFAKVLVDLKQRNCQQLDTILKVLRNEGVAWCPHSLLSPLSLCFNRQQENDRAFHFGMDLNPVNEMSSQDTLITWPNTCSWITIRAPTIIFTTHSLDGCTHPSKDTWPPAWHLTARHALSLLNEGRLRD